MKKLILLLIMLCNAAWCLKASDTLTVRQVFNFDVGDTFDYALTIADYDMHHFGASYSRLVISQKYVAPSQDTIIYNSNIIITNLDSIAVFQLDTNLHPTPPTVTIASFSDTGTYPNIRSNHISTGWEGGNEYGISEGLGLTFAGQTWITNDGMNFNSQTKSLIYYSKAQRNYGTPYYIVNGEAMIHYTPLPESCAVWNMLSAVPITPHDTLYEQIRTGMAIDTFGHHYVEMIYRSYDRHTGYYTSDSLLGYFINDSPVVLFTQSIVPVQPYSPAMRVLYDFSRLAGTSVGASYTSIYKDTIGGIPRTHWKASVGNDQSNPQNFMYTDYAEGVGSLVGLIDVHTPVGMPYFCSTLTSLCVCGQNIYPHISAGQCTLLTVVNNVFEDQQLIRVYPNPTTKLIHILILRQTTQKADFLLYNIWGQEVYSATLSNIESTHDISRLPPGIYTWSVQANGAIIKTGKLVKE